MAKNRGKDFETEVKRALEILEDCSYDRLRDVQFYRGSSNIADFAIYKKPYKVYFECKTTTTGTLPRANISDNQITGMTKERKSKGVSCGLLIWWQKFDETVFIPIQEVNRIFSNPEERSIKYRDLDNIDHIKIKGKKRKVLFTYDFRGLIEQVGERYE